MIWASYLKGTPIWNPNFKPNLNSNQGRRKRKQKKEKEKKKKPHSPASRVGRPNPRDQPTGPALHFSPSTGPHERLQAGLT